MSTSVTIPAALAILGLVTSLGAFAGDTARNEDRVDPQFAKQWDLTKAPTPKYTAAIAGKAATRDAFEFIGGDTGWQLTQHKYLLSAGAFVHSDECDHARTAAAPAPTSIEMERTLRYYPGG